MTGSNENRAEQFLEFGLKNGAHYFVEKVMPRFMEFLYRNFDVKATKEFWSNLAQQGYAEELKKGGVKAKAKFGKTNTPQKVISKPKCDHCNKLIGTKVAVQCEACNTLTLVECLTCLSEDRIK